MKIFKNYILKKAEKYVVEYRRNGILKLGHINLFEEIYPFCKDCEKCIYILLKLRD